MGKSYVAVGDIHGCLLTLNTLLERLPKDRVFVFIGDYIDRGPDSKGVVDRLIEFSRTTECIFLRGNHEQMMLDATKSAGHFRLWMLNGGGETLRSYGQFQMNFDPPSNHFHFYRNTRIFYETDDFVFVHGGLEPDRGIREQLDTDDENQLYDMMWERGHLKADTSHWEKTVVFGHTPVPEIHQAPKQLGIDTGCVYKKLPRLGVLTAALLPDMTFIQQPCLDNPQPY